MTRDEFRKLLWLCRVPKDKRRSLLAEWDGLAVFEEDRRFLVEDVEDGYFTPSGREFRVIEADE